MRSLESPLPLPRLFSYSQSVFPKSFSPSPICNHFHMPTVNQKNNTSNQRSYSNISTFPPLLELPTLSLHPPTTDPKFASKALRLAPNTKLTLSISLT
ncbi:hypothetical protein SLA2020_350390 [Shorea laevis]